MFEDSSLSFKIGKRNASSNVLFEKLSHNYLGLTIFFNN